MTKYLFKTFSEDLKYRKENDGNTTGWGDNFVGDVLASIVEQQ